MGNGKKRKFLTYLTLTRIFRYLFHDHIIEEAKRESILDFEKRTPSYLIYRLRRPTNEKLVVPFKPIAQDVFSSISVSRKKGNGD